jgi:tripartite-type tricarboxylate transporter receptor subunit TctC
MQIIKTLTRACTAVALSCAATAHAGAWPDHPITFIVPYSPATGIDLVARQLSVPLSKALGAPIVVENMAGASGNIGSEKTARAKPDGYTFMVQVNTLVMNHGLYKKLPYNPVTDFDPVSLTSWGTLLLVAPSARPWQTTKDLIASAKKEPGKLTYATPGVGTPHHLSMALFTQQAGIDMLHVPYKGTAGAVTDVLGGQIDTMFLPVHVALPQIKTGKLRALATGSPQRTTQLPDVPTLTEIGIQGGDVDMWYGVLAPKGTPAEIIDRMNREIAQALKAPEIAKAFEAQGMVPATSSPAEFRDLIVKDDKRWSELVKKAHITAE